MLIRMSIALEPSNVKDNDGNAAIIRASGLGLQQAQVDVETSFTVDARAASNHAEDLKVLVSSKLNSSFNEMHIV
jgi:hypothetical protein